MANHPAASPVPLMNNPLPTPEEPISIDITIDTSSQAPVHDPIAVISICHRIFCTHTIPEGIHVEEVPPLNPGMSFRLPLSLLFDRSRWQNVASGILDHFTFNSEIYEHLLQDLYIHGADWAEMTSRNGRTRLDVGIEVLQRLHIEITPLFLADLESMPPLEEASVGKSKELSEIAAGETCAICFEEFGGSRKAVTETQCSHIFHADCLLPWLSRASTCPLCRSSIR